jgi:hypothetical protein
VNWSDSIVTFLAEVSSMLSENSEAIHMSFLSRNVCWSATFCSGTIDVHPASEENLPHFVFIAINA